MVLTPLGNQFDGVRAGTSANTAKRVVVFMKSPSLANALWCKQPQRRSTVCAVHKCPRSTGWIARPTSGRPSHPPPRVAHPQTHQAKHQPGSPPLRRPINLHCIAALSNLGPIIQLRTVQNSLEKSIPQSNVTRPSPKSQRIGRRRPAASVE